MKLRPLELVKTAKKYRYGIVLATSPVFLYIFWFDLDYSCIQHIILSHFIFHLLLPLCIVIPFYLPKDIGFKMIEKKDAPLTLLVLFGSIIIAGFASTFKSMQDYYPMEYGGLASHPPAILLYLVKTGILMLACEFFYRGFLMMGTREKIGLWSIALQALPYGIMHCGKPNEEFIFSFFAGIIFGYVDYKTNSILPSFFAHFSGAVFLDFLCT